MRTALLFFAALGATNAFAAFGDVLYSYDVPGTGLNLYASGLAYGDTYLWCLESNAKRIYRIAPNNGSVWSSFVVPGAIPWGLAFGAGYLWYVDNNASRFYKVNPSTGSVVASFSKFYYRSFGVAHDGQYLWHSCLYNGSGDLRVLRLTEAGSLVLSYPYALSGQLPDLAYEPGGYLWGSSNGGGYVYRFVATTGSASASFPEPAGGTIGIAYDAGRIYVASDSARKIYVCDAVVGTTVIPASLGKIRAVFR